MDFIEQFKSYSKLQWAMIINIIIAVSLEYILHFNFEFSILIGNGLPIFFTNFHFIGVFIGALILGSIPEGNRDFRWILLNALLGLTFVVMIFSKSELVISLGLMIMGILIGGVWGLMMERFEAMGERKFAGRLMGMGVSGCFSILLIETLIDHYLDDFTHATLFIILLVVFIIFGIISKKVNRYPPQQPVRMWKFVKNKKNLPLIIFMLFMGFFFVNGYYTSILIMQINGLEAFLVDFYTVFLLTTIIIAFLAGWLADIIGRRKTFVAGICIQALAFLLLFIGDLSTIMKLVFPIVLGVGYAMSVSSGVRIMAESLEEKELKYKNYIYVGLMGLGCMFGSVFAELMRPVLAVNPSLMAMVLFFVFLIATLVVLQLNETLPSKEELEWKESIQYLYVIRKTGLTLYSQDLCQLQKFDNKCNEDLLGGALSAISTLMKEITANSAPLKTIQQEGFSLLLEEGDKVFVVVMTLKELKVIRKIMKEFIEEFENLYEEVLEKDSGDLEVFKPTKKIIQRHFV